MPLRTFLALINILCHLPLSNYTHYIFLMTGGMKDVEAVLLFRENAHKIDIVIPDMAMAAMIGHEL